MGSEMCIRDRSSPIPSLLCDAGEPPRDVRRENIALRCYVWVQRLTESPTAGCILKSASDAAFANRPSLPRPMGVRSRITMEEWVLTLGPVLPFSLSVLTPWSVPELAYCCCLDIPKSRLSDEAL